MPIRVLAFIAARTAAMFSALGWRVAHASALQIAANRRHCSTFLSAQNATSSALWRSHASNSPASNSDHCAK